MCMVQTGGKESNYTSIAGAGVERDWRVRIVGGGRCSGASSRVGVEVSASDSVRDGIRVMRTGKVPPAGGIVFGAFKEGLLETASKVSSNKWGDREWAASRGASME